MPEASSASKTRTKRLLCGVASCRAAASPRHRIAILERRGVCCSVSISKLHDGLGVAQSLDRGLTGSLPVPRTRNLDDRAQVSRWKWNRSERLRARFSTDTVPVIDSELLVIRFNR